MGNDMQNFSLHTHSLGFDGKNTESEMVKQAIKLGWKAIGFSNHFIVHPLIKRSPMYVFAQKGGYDNIYSASFDEAVSKFDTHYKKIDELNEWAGIHILKGMEVDFFSYDGWRDDFNKAVEYLKPDYLIGAAHFIYHNGVLLNSHDVKKAKLPEQNMLLHKYWQNERAMIKSQLFDIVAHMDLMKKVGIGQGIEWQQEEKKTICEIKKYHTIVEINTSYFKFGDEPYPSKRIMNMLADEKIPVLISDDAHESNQMGKNFYQAANMAEQCGISNFCDVNISKRTNLNEFLLHNVLKSYEK